MRFPSTSRLLAGWRLVRIPVILFMLYFALRLVLAALSERHGFGSPDGLGLIYLTVSAVVMALRIVLLVVVPAVITYRVVTNLVARILGGAKSNPATRGLESP